MYWKCMTDLALVACSDFVDVGVQLKNLGAAAVQFGLETLALNALVLQRCLQLLDAPVVANSDH